VSLWTPLAIPRIWDRWFQWPNLLFLAPVPLLTAFAAWRCWWGLETRHDTVPFVSALALFLLGFLGLAISTLPYLVPPSVTIWDAAAHPSSQTFMLVGVLLMLPIILAYTVFVYYTFRGKLKPGEGYH
jgi:cytochrome d ubiquinol oxidase subunit II